jgi:hypothetical protein
MPAHKLAKAIKYLQVRKPEEQKTQIDIKDIQYISIDTSAKLKFN